MGSIGLVKQSEFFSVKAIGSNVRRANPELTGPGFINRVDIVLAQSFDVRKGGKLVSIESAKATVSRHFGLVRLHTSKPDVSLLVL